MGDKLGHVVGEENCLVAGAGDGDVAKAEVEQVRKDAGIGVVQYMLRSEPLGNGETPDSAGTEGLSR